jgi:hypothetical protein
VPDIAVDLNANSLGLGNVYVVWEDTTSGSASSDDVVYLSRSTNGGATWSAPSPVDKTPPGKAAFLPAVHVAANGVVGVTYYDLRSNDANPGLPTDIWLVHSHDAGATFGDEAHIAGPFDMTTAPDAGGLFVGDYDGLTSIGSAFVPFFVATNNGNTANRTDVFSTQAVPVP